MRDQTPDPGEVTFEIFRGKDAPPLQIKVTTGLTDIALEGMKKVAEAGGADIGYDTRVLFEVPGFSLTYAWFKSHYHLPRHSHCVEPSGSQPPCM